MCFAFGCVRAAVVGIALVGCALAAGMVQPTQREPIGPRINIEFTQIDIGTISDARPVTVSFRFTNTGDQPLEMLAWELPSSGTRPLQTPPILPASDIFVDAVTNEGFVGPRLTVHPRVYDAYVNADGSCTVSIPFQNTGDMPLEIVYVIGPDL